MLPLVFLGDTSDRQEFRGRSAHKEFLEVLDRPPGLLRGGPIDTLLHASYIPFDRVPVDVGPRGDGVFFSPFDEGFHRLTSPKIRTLRQFFYRQDQTAVCTLSGWVCPLRRPYPPYYRAAFAFSVLFYPLLRPPALRSEYHGCGEHRAYPVVNEEECGPARLESVPRWA